MFSKRTSPYYICSPDVSQETDSDAESILSDTKTILSPGEMRVEHPRVNSRLPGDTQSVCSLSLSSRTVSDSSDDSHHSDVEVCNANIQFASTKVWRS